MDIKPYRMAKARGKILIIDDEEKLRKLLLRIISLEGYEAEEAGTLEEGRKKLSQNTYQLVLCDVKLPDGNGVEFIPEFKEKYPQTEIVSLTAYGTIRDGVQAMKSGAFDYLTKGDDNDKIIPLTEKAVEKALQAQKLQRLLQREKQKYSFDSIIGESPLLKQAIRMGQKVAPTSTNVLLSGETGTGKEVFANAIHQASGRASENFVAVNCSAFNNELLASEIFGHKAGAFTGAHKDKKGLYEEADGGTLFLDEIGEMDLDLQAKLLRVLESGKFIKVGDTKETQVDVRVIAATNRKLEEDAKKERFRLDLYYRLSTFSIELPSLNEREGDILTLAENFVEQLSLKLKRQRPEMSEDFKDALLKHEWKGNVRELRNVIERALIITEDDRLEPSSLPFSAMSGNHQAPDSLLLSEVEKHHIQRVLQQTKGNKSESAKLLGIGLTTLYRKIEEYEIVL